jgi:hypothetical protein
VCKCGGLQGVTSYQPYLRIHSLLLILVSGVMMPLADKARKKIVFRLSVVHSWSTMTPLRSAGARGLLVRYLAAKLPLDVDTFASGLQQLSG